MPNVFVTGNGGKKMVVIITYLETHMSLLTRCNILSSLCNFYDGDIVVVALYKMMKLSIYLLGGIIVFSR